ncbi:MAG: hypothetical protein HY741_09910 [Chloroflexi bacterium]|nr:hypothetical protein [Chloroflexota bacterium]
MAPLPTPKVLGKEGVLTSIPVKTAPILDGTRTMSCGRTRQRPSSTYRQSGIRVQYPDSNMDVDRHAWAYNVEKKAWEILADDYGDEDEFGFFWNYNIPVLYTLAVKT